MDPVPQRPVPTQCETIRRTGAARGRLGFARTLKTRIFNPAATFGCWWIPPPRSKKKEKDDAVVVGMVGLQMMIPSSSSNNSCSTTKTAELRRMCILPAYRGRGWGTKMAETVLQFAQDTAGVTQGRTEHTGTRTRCASILPTAWLPRYPTTGTDSQQSDPGGVPGMEPAAVN